MKSVGITSVVLLTLVLANPSAGEAQVLRPNELCGDQPDETIATFEDANLEVRLRAALSISDQDDSLHVGISPTTTTGVSPRPNEHAFPSVSYRFFRAGPGSVRLFEEVVEEFDMAFRGTSRS